MKRFAFPAVAPSAIFSRRIPFVLSVLVVFLSFTSCVYDAYGDEFYRTLWVSEEMTAGESPAEITLEYLCGNSVCIKADGAAGSYGKYESDGTRSRFRDLSLTYDIGGTAVVVIIEEATRNGDRLLLSWHNSKSRVAQFTSMKRLSSYE